MLSQLSFPIAGATASLSFASVSNVSLLAGTVQLNVLIVNTQTLLFYILIGILGALGGLLFRMFWCLLKRKFPCLKILVNEKNSRQIS